MTMLADLKAGQAFMFICQVTLIDAAGFHLSLFGPAQAAGGTALMDPAGVLTGQLTTPANQIPVSVVTQFVIVSAGDILVNDVSGETMVARAAWITPDGTYQWSSTLDKKVAYPSAGWQVIGHVIL